MSPKQWSPCRCEMNMWFMNEKCMCPLRNCSCVPSPQSIINCLLPILTTCELALWRVVGSAEPQPNMCTSNGSIAVANLANSACKCKYDAIIKGIKKGDRNIPVTFVMILRYQLFAFTLEFVLECCKSIDVTESCCCCLVLDCRSCLLCSFLALASCCSGFLLSFLLLFSCILEDTAVRKDDSLSFLVELDYLEREFLLGKSQCAVLYYKVLRSCKALYAVGERYNCALVDKLCDNALVD